MNTNPSSEIPQPQPSEQPTGKYWDELRKLKRVKVVSGLSASGIIFTESPKTVSTDESLVIDYSKFSLPLPTADDSDKDLEEDAPLSKDEMLDAMQGLIPKEAIFIGSIDSKIDNWTSWEIEDHFYLIPINSDGFNWAFFRITWDDNWARYDLDLISRAKGVASASNAVQEMMASWIKKCRIEGPEEQAYSGLANIFSRRKNVG